MANEFVARKGLKILEVAEETTINGSISFIDENGTLKKITVENFYDETGIQLALDTATAQAILSAAARNDSENFKNIANSERLLAENARDLAESSANLSSEQAILSAAARDAAETFASNALLSEQNAAQSATNALASEQAALLSEQNAAQSAAQANIDVQNAINDILPLIYAGL
jgi:hypothetical protein